MTNPFKDGSKIAKAFDMAVKGTTRDAINKFCEKEKLNAPRIFHCLRRGTYAESKWKYTQTDDGAVKLVPGTTAVKVKAKKVEAKAKAKTTKKVAAPKKAVAEKKPEAATETHQAA